MQLESGFYKVVKGQGRMKSFHYLRVFVQDKQRYYQFDFSVPNIASSEAVQSQMEDVEVVKKIHRSPSALKARVTIVWDDEDGDSYEFSARSVYPIRQLFKQHPALAQRLDAKGS